MLHVLQPAIAVQQAARFIGDDVTEHAFCGSGYQSDSQQGDSRQAIGHKLCGVCCPGTADITAPPALPAPTRHAWLPRIIARATPVRGPPLVQARARAPPAFS